MTDAKPDEEPEKESKPIIVRNTTDLQRLKLEKLMKNPEKPIVIPERPKERGVPVVPDFVRNVMGSSAGAGSGEFHVYRHLRRKEYARQKYMKEKGERERLDNEYHEKLEEYKRKAEEKTAKKRRKRLKKKQKGKKKKPKVINEQSGDSETSNSDDESEESQDDKTSEQEVVSENENKDISKEVNTVEGSCINDKQETSGCNNEHEGTKVAVNTLQDSTSDQNLQLQTDCHDNKK